MIAGEDLDWVILYYYIGVIPPRPPSHPSPLTPFLPRIFHRPSYSPDHQYVRKNAAVCVAKLYDIAPDLVQERGFIETLHDLISDSNPSVVANGVAALSEISETSGRDVMRINASVLQKLLAALNECTEWGQVFILDSLAKYTPAEAREAEGIIERVTPRLQHANSAVVMSAVKVILSYMDVMGGGARGGLPVGGGEAARTPSPSGH